MDKTLWQLTAPIDVISFDCDGTLSQIEGIDLLAHQKNVGEEVKHLTQRAMNETGISSELYEKRLLMVKPSRQQLIELGQEYYYQHSKDTVIVIQALKSLDKSVYILSAGLNPSVKIFGSLLGISEKKIFAVDAYFDENGNFKDYDRQAPTAEINGKHDIIENLKSRGKRVAHIGDGMNDYEVNVVADRFIGYGGVEYRENIAALCDFYIKSPSLAPVLPLCITEEELQKLPDKFKSIYLQGLELLNNDQVILNKKII